MDWRASARAAGASEGEVEAMKRRRLILLRPVAVPIEARGQHTRESAEEGQTKHSRSQVEARWSRSSGESRGTTMRREGRCCV